MAVDRESKRLIGELQSIQISEAEAEPLTAQIIVRRGGLRRPATVFTFQAGADVARRLLPDRRDRRIRDGASVSITYVTEAQQPQDQSGTGAVVFRATHIQPTHFKRDFSLRRGR